LALPLRNNTMAKLNMAQLLKKKKEAQKNSYYQKHQKNQKGKPATGKETNIGHNDTNS